MPDDLAYPWNGGTWSTPVRIFAPDEKDEEGDDIGEWIIGLGDYAEEGSPDLWIRLHRDEHRHVVEWVAAALERAAQVDDHRPLPTGRTEEVDPAPAWTRIAMGVIFGLCAGMAATGLVLAVLTVAGVIE